MDQQTVSTIAAIVSGGTGVVMVVLAVREAHQRYLMRKVPVDVRQIVEDLPWEMRRDMIHLYSFRVKKIRDVLAARYGADARWIDPSQIVATAYKLFASEYDKEADDWRRDLEDQIKAQLDALPDVTQARRASLPIERTKRN